MSRLTPVRLLAILLFLALIACHHEPAEKSYNRSSPGEIKGEAHYIDGYPALYENGDINVVVEIPAGSDQKWEVDKQDGNLKWEMADGKPRKIHYLGYPANYGMIPRTLLPENQGGDGDPLDVIIPGPPACRGQVIRCKVIGVLYLSDGGERDDKLIAVYPGNAFSEIISIKDLDEKFPGIIDIMLTWFTNYKGPGKVSSSGFGDKDEAVKILKASIDAYRR